MMPRAWIVERRDDAEADARSLSLIVFNSNRRSRDNNSKSFTCSFTSVYEEGTRSPHDKTQFYWLNMQEGLEDI